MQPLSENIILIGMPAVGKSTLGVLLAKRLGRDSIEVQAGSQENARDGEESPTPEVRGEPTKLFR